MIFYLTSRILTKNSAVGAFLYPGYASYKTLSQRPASEEEIERWLMYWTVLGCIVGVEYVAEWAVCWIPLYYPLKTLFLLYLALPQTRGATFIYNVHLRPLFATHEADIDSALAQLRVFVYNFLQTQLRALWAHVSAAAGQSPDTTPPTQAAPEADPATAGLSLSGAVGSFWRAYGPSIMASGAAFLHSAAPPPQRSMDSPAAPPTQSLLERRRQLEAELAALSAADPSTAMPMSFTPNASPSTTYSARSSDSNLHQRGRADSAQFRFEEVEVPSDVEGYDVRDDSDGSRPAPAQRGSWFGWGSGGKPGYERVKTD
ncbi:TB2/DP1, HVA22 family-domain-containing protein [Mycena amicta]|nr:TB2/DP1, HVA22 family-domain-containing protein [Mycena amicta]